MCEFCISHGEGKKWYEVMQNYSAELYSKGDRENFAKKLVKQTQTSIVPGLEKMIKLRNKSPLVYKYVRRMGTLHNEAQSLRTGRSIGRCRNDYRYGSVNY